MAEHADATQRLLAVVFIVIVVFAWGLTAGYFLAGVAA